MWDNTSAMKSIIWLLPVFCCFFACDFLNDSGPHARLNVCNGKYTQLKGRLMDAYSKQGLANAKFEVTLDRSAPSDPMCWVCFTEVIGSALTDHDGYFDFKLPLDSMDLNYTYYIDITKYKYFGKSMIIDDFSKLDTLYNLELYMNQISKITLSYTNTITDTIKKLVSYFYRVSPDTSLYEDVCPFPIYSDFLNGNRYYVDAYVRTFGSENLIVTPSVIITDCFIMQYETKDLHYLVNDTFSVASNESVSKHYVLTNP